MTSQQTRNAPRLRRLKEPRWLIVAAGVTLMVILTALVFVQQSTVAAPPPPLRGPFRLIQLPASAKAQTDSGTVNWVPFYTQTFDSPLVGWTITQSTSLYANPAPLQWDRVLVSNNPNGSFTNTLWVGAYQQYRLVNYSVAPNSTYTKTMDTMAIYPVDPQQYARFQLQFDYWLDTESGAQFGWAYSCDGSNFYFSNTTSGHIRRWQTVKFGTGSCPNQSGGPAYLAFFFQSSDTQTPVGLGAFVDNVFISGMPWYKTYYPIIRKDPTSTASPTPTAVPIAIGVLVRPKFDYTGEEDPRWCLNDNDAGGTAWTAKREPVGDGRYGNSYRLATFMPGRTMLQSNHFDPGVPNYGIETQFSLLDMTGMDLTRYINTKFGLFFGVEGNGTDGYPLDPNDGNHCSWDENAGGYYRAFVRVNDSGTGYEYKLQRVWHGGKTDLDTEVHPEVQISTTDWNTMRVNRNGSGILVYVNGIQVLSATDSTWLGSRWWGFMLDEVANYSLNQPWRVNWDNTGVYNLTP